MQLEAILKGLNDIIPAPLLTLLTWQDLQLRVCGRSTLDLEVLKRHTQYRGGIFPTDKHIQYFWKVLEEFNEEEKRLFLRFAYGRERLPPESELKNENMKIFPITSRNPDSRLPQAETCFFNVKLPSYTSKSIMKDKLRYAIMHSRSMDGDVENTRAFS